VKLAVNLALSLIMLALSLWLVWPSEASRPHLEAAISGLTLREFGPHCLGFFAIVAVVHFCRAYRWNNLLAPIGVRLPFGKLMAVSTVGFLAILIVPARLGELVRPALIRKKGHVSASAALGTVAVERIIDGLVVSIMVFVTFFMLRGPLAPSWMMPVAYSALAIFGVATLGLVFALRWPTWTVATALKLSLLSVLFPSIARRLETKLHDLIRGFEVLRDPRNLTVFLAWTVFYWLINGVGSWLLARGMGLDLSLTGAIAMMGLVAVGITLPNSPGMVGQFQWFTMLGVSLSLGSASIEADAPTYGVILAYAIFIHALSLAWYLVTGLIALATRHVSFAEVWASRTLEGDEPVPSEASGRADG
jgi:uncharacterized protein (TIRG00374 family)